MRRLFSGNVDGRMYVEDVLPGTMRCFLVETGKEGEKVEIKAVVLGER